MKLNSCFNRKELIILCGVINQQENNIKCKFNTKLNSLKKNSSIDRLCCKKYNFATGCMKLYH